MIVIAGSLLMIAFLLACARRQRQQASKRAFDRVAGFSVVSCQSDYSRFDQEQMLRNRSERWDG